MDKQCHLPFQKTNFFVIFLFHFQGGIYFRWACGHLSLNAQESRLFRWKQFSWKSLLTISILRELGWSCSGVCYCGRHCCNLVGFMLWSIFISVVVVLLFWFWSPLWCVFWWFWLKELLPFSLVLRVHSTCMVFVWITFLGIVSFLCLVGLWSPPNNW